MLKPTGPMKDRWGRSHVISRCQGTFVGELGVGVVAHGKEVRTESG